MLHNLQKNIKIDETASLPGTFFLRLLKYHKTGNGRICLKNQQGFTLVEILVAVSLMLTVLFAVIGMQVVALRSNSIANQLTVATSLASEAIEDISSPTWSSNSIGLTNGATTLRFDATSNTYNTYTYQSAGVYTITCFPTNNSPLTGIVRLDVTVTYNYKGNSKSVTMSGFKRVI
jgi:prepilin-type N-terminal cleavage/methylation domain-containing protein